MATRTSTFSGPVQKKRNPFSSGAAPFYSPSIQPKLTVNAPNDPFEKEADQAAETVMRKAQSPRGTFFQPAAPTITPIQRKCAACEEEERLQRQEDEQELTPPQIGLQHDGSDEEKPPEVQRQLIDCSKFTMKEDAIDAEDAAALEAEEPATTGGEEGGEEGAVQRKCKECEEEEKSVQRKCKECEEEEKSVQRQEAGGASTASSSFATALSASKRGGSTLPGETRSFMESRFGADFSGVRVHSDSSSASLSSSINAHAFTHGQDIYFNSGQYSPGSSGGQQLLAHELAHVVQQNGSSVQPKTKASAFTGPPDIQRAFYFSSRPRTSGTAIHKAVLTNFVRQNPDLFIEVSIPGANKTDVDKGKTGIADFYKASTTVGLKFDTAPANLKRDSDFEAGSGIVPKNFDHAKHSAPKGADTKPRVRRLNLAPFNIQIGDLKPGASGETVLGESQVGNYISGIENTRDNLNAYLRSNPDESDSTTKQWAANPTRLSSLTIPTELRYTQGTGIRGLQNRKLALYREGDFRAYHDLDFTGTLYVYKDTRDGVWSYEWIPDAIPATTGSPEVNTVVDRLNNNVIPALTQTQGTSIAPKRTSVGRYPIFRKPQKFSDEAWKKQFYTPWKKRATKVLGNKSEVKKAEVGAGVLDVEKRSGLKINAPESLRAQGRGLPKIRHWKRFGGFYGWLREKFDVLYVKVKGVVDKVKKKVGDLAKRAGSTTFGSWIKAVAKVVFKIFKMLGSWVVTQVMDKLLNSLREGVLNNIRKLVEKALPDEAKTYLERFCALQKQYEDIIAQKEDDIITLLFGDKLKLFETADEIEKKIGYVADIATLIEWGVRLLACASPPAIGCLWNLAIEALKAIFARLIQTCWFTKEVYAPIINKVNFVKQFPSQLASGLVDILNQHLPVPEGLDKWFATVKVNVDEFKVDCNEAADGASGLTSDRRAIFEIAKQEDGDKKLKAALQLMLKRGAGPWVLLTKERTEKLMAVLEKADLQEVTEAAVDKTKPIPAGFEELIGEIGTYTPKEKKLIADAKAEKERKAAEAALKKEIEEILADPKAKEALAKPFPSKDQLKKDLEGFHWDIPKGEGGFFNISGRTLFLMKTDTGARIGAYFKYYPKVDKGITQNRILEIGEFYALDEIPKNDCVTFSTRDKKGSPGLLFFCFAARAKGSFFASGQGLFFGTAVDIQ